MLIVILTSHLLSLADFLLKRRPKSNKSLLKDHGLLQMTVLGTLIEAARKLMLAVRKLVVAARKLMLAFRKLIVAVRKLIVDVRNIMVAVRKLIVAVNKLMVSVKTKGDPQKTR